MPGLSASVILIGDELLTGDVADTNGPFLAERLTDQGFRVRDISVVPDDPGRIVAAVRYAAETYRLTVVCGGLGPTSDDLTTESLARAFDRSLILDEEQWTRIRQGFLAIKGQEPPPGNEKQATFPEGADILKNDMGTAPGYTIKAGNGVIAVMPGPPKENRPMFDKELQPWLERNMPERDPWLTRAFRVFGLPESEVGHRLSSLEAGDGGLHFSYRFFFPEILVKLRCEAGKHDLLESASERLTELLAPHVYGTGAERLPAVFGRALEDRGLRIVTAESCTGGLVAKLLTDIPGSSSWVDRGFVTYTDKAKREVLGVPGKLLEEHGAVSEPVARAMLEGALERSDADLGLGLTGVAGPTGGSPEKPVGTICIAWGGAADNDVRTYRFIWDREYNRILGAWVAMYELYSYLLR